MSNHIVSRLLRLWAYHSFRVSQLLVNVNHCVVARRYSDGAEAVFPIHPKLGKFELNVQGAIPSCFIESGKFTTTLKVF
jgi:hypothetical protein